MWSVPTHLRCNLLQDLEGPHAQRVDAACFLDGSEDEHRVEFFRLWGRLVRRHYNRRTDATALHFVDGEDLELFNYFYPEGSRA